MIRALVSIEVDLSSSYALRYACQLGQVLHLEVQPVYVKGEFSQEPTTGVGWVRHTWEREIIKEGKEEISQMITAEMDSCPTLAEPLVVYGDREAELMKIMSRQAYDLYVEGAPYPFTPATIYQRLQKKFYQRLETPLIWLRLVRKIDRVLLVCLEAGATQYLTGRFQRFWASCPVPVHLGFPGGQEELLREVKQSEAALKEAGCWAEVLEPWPMAAGRPAVAAVQDYGLVVLAVDRNIKRDDPLLPWLAQVKAPLLVILK